MKTTLREIQILVVMAILFAIIPIFGEKYLTYLCAKVLILILFSVAFNVVFGYTGLLSFGHALFFSIGAYSFGIFVVKFGFPLFIGAVLGVFLAGLIALGVGCLSLRHREIHFVMITLAFSMLWWGLVMKWRDITGGDDGIRGIPRVPEEMFGFYYLCLAIVFASILIIYKFVNSNVGLILRGIRENETRVRFSGHSVMKFRIYSLTISGLFSGMAGILWAMLEKVVTPTSAHWSFSAIPVISSLIGGPSYFFGPILGTIFYFLIHDIATRYTLYWEITLGVIVVIMVLFFREGVVAMLYKKLKG